MTSQFRRTDLHCHVLPGVDDGPAGWDEALGLAVAAWHAGTTRLVATPHIIQGGYYTSPDRIKELSANLSEKLREASVDLEVIPACEVQINPSLPDDFACRKVLPIGNSGYILVELPFDMVPGYTRRVLFELQLAGAGVIIAHPERNRDLRRNFKLLYELADAGILFQVNAGSLVGAYGREVEAAAQRMVREGLIHFIGSDAHSGKNPSLLERGPDMNDALRRIARLSRDGESFLEKLESMAERLLAGSL